MLEKETKEADILIKGFVNEVEQSLTDEFPLDDLEFQAQAFRNYKGIHSRPEASGFEGHTWKTSPELLQNSFLDAWQYQKMKKNNDT
jgi:hypothetical protein